MRTDTPKTIHLKDYQPPKYLVDHIDLTFRIYDDRTLVSSKISFKKNHEGDEPIHLNGEHLKLISVRLDGEDVAHNMNENELLISCPDASEFIIETEVEIDPASNTRLEGLYKSGGNWCTQCESQGFRSITYFPDRPDVMTTFMVRIEADKKICPVLLSNGNLIEEGDLPDDDSRHYTLWHDPFPKPCYLFALVAGDLVHIEDRFNTVSGREVLLRIYVRDGDQEQCTHAMVSLKKSMKWDEEVYGREYQLDRFNIVAVSDFNMGAMENTSLNIFNTALVLAHQDTATDADFGRVEGVIAHEYFHNWTGNRVTCRDWFQLSLKEGLTVFRDQEFSADMNSRDVQRIDDVALLRRMQFPEDAGPMAHPIRPDNYIEINNFYTVTVYEKGAEVIRMQRTLLGPETYRKGTDLYFERYDGQAVTCDDFVECMADASDIDLSQFFLWYQQAGTPEITATGKYDENSRTYTLDISQQTPGTPGQAIKKPLHIPVAVGLVGANGNDMDLEDDETTRTLHLTEAHQSFVFENIPSKPIPSILRGFSAPVKLKVELDDEELHFLMVHDSDGFNRWEAGQNLSLRIIGEMLDLHEQGHDYQVDADYVRVFGEILDQAFNPDTDKALLARSLSLPDIPIIAQQRRVVDPAAIYKIRMEIIHALFRNHKDKFEKIYHENTDSEFSTDFEFRSRRDLKNIALYYLLFDRDNPMIDLAKEQYEGANNMTDRVAALMAMSHLTARERDDAFDRFYRHFKDYELVVNKWFSLQVAATRPEVLDDIKMLRDHSEFNIKNPNRVRSLYSAFAMNNPLYFHDVSGKGYDFLGDAIIELNGLNPQIAARMLTPFRDWRHYTQDRQEKMKQVLQRIADMPDLSPDVFEIVSKTLS